MSVKIRGAGFYHGVNDFIYACNRRMPINDSAQLRRTSIVL